VSDRRVDRLPDRGRRRQLASPPKENAGRTSGPAFGRPMLERKTPVQTRHQAIEGMMKVNCEARMT